MRATSRLNPPDALTTDRDRWAFQLGIVACALQVAEDDEFRRPMPGIYRASLEGQRDWLIGLLEEGAP